MLRSLSAVLLLVAMPGFAELWPEMFSGYKRVSAAKIAITDRDVWTELGLEETERARYEGKEGAFTAEAFRLRDPTSALAVFQWRMPAASKPSDLHKVAAETTTGATMILGNYYVSFEGRKPTVDELAELFVILPRLDQSALPTLPNFLPSSGLVPASSRFIIGPAALAKFESRIPPSVAAFSMGAEAQLGSFESKAGILPLVIFSYPTPNMARERLTDFQKLPGAIAKRTGPLVAVTFTKSADEAERLLALVNYQATITLDQDPTRVEPSFAEFIITVFKFIGFLIGIEDGFSFGHYAFRMALRKWLGRPENADGFLTLDIGPPASGGPVEKQGT